VRQFGLYPLWTIGNLREFDPSKFCYFSLKSELKTWLITVKPSYGYDPRSVQYVVQLLYNSLEDRNPLKGNTVGSQLSTEKAYIAGFLDGDGSIMLQLKKRSDTSRGYRFQATICIYQDSRHDANLHWIQKILSAGYISRRKDGMTELRIQGFKTVQTVLLELQPYIRFKALQAEAMIAACNTLRRGIRNLSQEDLLLLIQLTLAIQNNNYKSNRRKSETELLMVLGLTP